MPLWLSLVLIAAVIATMWWVKRPTQTPPPAETNREIPKPTVIKPPELEQMLTEKPDDIFILDVRGRKEYTKGQKLERALNVPVSFIMYRIKSIPRDKTIVTVCASGNRSLTGAAVLLMQDFPKVVSLEGGMNAWLAYKNMPRQPGCG